MRATYQAGRQAVRREMATKRWRGLAQQEQVSAEARQRLEWLIFYNTVGQHNARRTAAYFGISTKTFHKWKGRFDPTTIRSLEDHSRRPNRPRGWQVSLTEQYRIKRLRRRYPRYGKAKLKVLYQQTYHEPISTWKIERVIRFYQLYPDPERTLPRAKSRPATAKTRIHRVAHLSELFLWHVDSIQLWWDGQRRYIFTAIEHRARLGFAHIYLRGSSRQATDFLQRLLVLTEGRLPCLHSDNGGEFAGHFAKACQQLGIQRFFSRVRHPTDNPRLERFNWTLQHEWLDLSDVGLDLLDQANQDLTDWLIHYNAFRPHQALAYLSPLDYASAHQVLPISPASTPPCAFRTPVLS
jgi:transposase InsO family protein